MWNWDSAVNITTGLPSGRSGVRVAARKADISLLQNAQTVSGFHTTSYWRGTGVFTRGGNAIGAWNWPLINIQCRFKSGVTPPLPLHSFMLWTGENSTFFCCFIWSLEQWNGLASCRYRSAANRASQYACGYVTHGRTTSWWILSIP